MRSFRAIAVIAPLVAWPAAAGLCLAYPAGAQSVAPPYYYETSFVAQSPTSGEDVGTVSAMEFNGLLTPLFIDYTTGAGFAATNTAAALDANYSLRPPHIPYPGNPNWGPIYPSGHLAVAKTSPSTAPQIDFYALWNVILAWEQDQNTWQTITGTTRPQSPTWSVPTASGSPVMAMGVANGFPLANQNPLPRTDYLITAETLGGHLTLGAYGLTDAQGNLAQPALVSWRQYTNPPAPIPPNSTVVGMAISNGTHAANWERTRNEIVLVVQYANPAQALWVHSVTFDLRTLAFSALNTGTAYSNNTPLNLTSLTGSTNFGGIAIARNTAIAQVPPRYSHDVAISIGNATAPLTQRGTVFVFRPQGALTMTPGFGGGPVCHIPGSDYNPTTQVYTGVAAQVFLGAPTKYDYGWYVVHPGPAGGAGTGIGAFNSARMTGMNFFYNLQPQDVFNGPPAPHPGGFTKVGAARMGMLSIPLLANGTTPVFDFVEGAFPIPGPGAQMPYAIPPGQPNHVPTPPGAPATLPKQNTAWPATSVISGLSFLSEYGLYINGY